VLTFRYDDVTNYRRILSFDTFDSASDNGFYANDGVLSFYDEGANDAVSASLFDDTFADIAFTRTTDGTVSAYAGGALQLAYADATGQAIIRTDGLRFFQDNGSEQPSGQVARIRIYDGALTAAEVADIEQTGGLRGGAAAVSKPKAGPRKKKPKSVSSGISLSCPAEGVACPTSVAVRAKVKGKERILGSLAGELPSGAGAVPGVKLSKKGRKYLAKKGKQPISIDASVTAGSGTPATATNRGKV